MMRKGCRRQRTWLVAVTGLLVLWMAATAGPAVAEWSFDAYVGRTFVPDGDFMLRDDNFNQSLGFDDSFIVGGRLGYWLGFLPFLGVALDASYYTADLESLPNQEPLANADLKRLPLSGLVLLRLPLFLSPGLPFGRLQPYVAAGPTVFLANLDLNALDESRADVGLDARVGLNVRFTRTLGIFVEYRLTYVEQQFDFTADGVRSQVESDPSTHHILGGLSLRF